MNVSQVKKMIQEKRSYYKTLEEPDSFDFGVLYACEVFLKSIEKDSDPEESSSEAPKITKKVKVREFDN